MRFHIFADFEDVSIWPAVARSPSFTLQAKIVGLSVSRKNGLVMAFSSGVSATVSAGLPASSAGSKFLEDGLVRERDLCRRAWRPWRLSPGVSSRLPRSHKHQFGVDDLDVAHGIHAAGDVMDVCVVEAAHDLHNGVHFADVGEEFIAETLALRRALDEAGDVHEFNRRRNDDVRLGDFCKT
jgi:hypothetical protein